MEAFRIDHDLHIHSYLSLCSGDPEQNNDNILAWGRKNGLRKLVLTNHFWDDDLYIPPEWYHIQNYAHVCEAKPLPQAPDCRFFFGIEGEMDMNGTVGIVPGTYDRFDFIIIPTTHLHMDGFAIDASKDGSLDGRARAWVRRFESLLATDLPAGKTGIAHLTCPLIAGFEDTGVAHLDVVDRISDDDCARVFTAAAKRDIGVELNMPITIYGPDDLPRVLRPYRIAKECGCKFYLGSDAHTPAELADAMERFELMVRLLELTEEDKYSFARS